MKVPQADDLGKVIKIPYYVSLGKKNSAELALELRLTVRQALYYSEASQIMGFLKKNKNEFEVTVSGTEFLNSTSNKKEIVFETIKRIPIFDKIIKRAYTNQNGEIKKREIAEIIQKETGLSVSTAIRRSNTILSWFYWISYHFPEFCNCEKNHLVVYYSYGQNRR